jgi:hypothetical protein
LASLAWASRVIAHRAIVLRTQLSSWVSSNLYRTPLSVGGVFVCCAIETVPRRFQHYAVAAANAGSSCGKGLNLMAIRKAPMPIAQEPT